MGGGNIMRSTIITVIITLIITGIMTPKAYASIGLIPLDCDRACLENVVEQYLDALVAHDPKRLPLSKDVMYTENKGTLSDGRPHEFPGFSRPSSILVIEAFLIEDGKIRRVEMIGPGTLYHMNSPWPGGLSGD